MFVFLYDWTVALNLSCRTGQLSGQVQLPFSSKTTDQSRAICLSFITTHLVYCNALYFGMSQTQFPRLQLVLFFLNALHFCLYSILLLYFLLVLFLSVSITLASLISKLFINTTELSWEDRYYHRFRTEMDFLLLFLSHSGLWLCSVPSEQHDGGDTLWVPHVHGK